MELSEMNSEEQFSENLSFAKIFPNRSKIGLNQLLSDVMLSEINTEQLISYLKELENSKLCTLQLMAKKKFLKFSIFLNKEELDLPCTTLKSQ